GTQMKKLSLMMSIVLLMMTFLSNGFAQENPQKNSTEKPVMHRFVVERTFPTGLNIPINEVGRDLCLNVVSNNAEDLVTWVHSYVTIDKKKTFCIYDAPSEDAIRRAAKINNLPVDKVTEVTVLDPYFYK
ncbi:MAG TPA: DUF4242 domain-containing protein, partial [Ignavibacteriaceae bacterium]|nr:DUF4242 domain-containing protein [Ignavibacteriaceae bacterium]